MIVTKADVLFFSLCVCVLVGGVCGGECQPTSRSHLDEEQPAPSG